MTHCTVLEDHRGALTVDTEVAIIADSVEPAFKRGVEEVKKELETYLPRDDDREQDLIQDALDSADLATLHEQLDLLRGPSVVTLA